jgi:glycosyltransferase involved in cell wall biosynthesis
VISVIIPTKNRPKMMRRALQSVLRQEHPDLEVIVVDDGAGDGVEAALELEDPRVTAFCNPGRGQTDARNSALKRARGDVIALLDDDDWWEDAHHLHRVSRALRDGPALVYRGGWLVMERDGLELQRLPYNLRATVSSLHRDNALLASGVAYPRSLHDRLSLFDPHVGHYWDWDWYLRVVDAGYGLRAILTPGIAIAVHASNESSTSNTSGRERDLRTLCLKHNLGEIPLKNHLTLLTDGPSLEPPALSFSN